jgi:hypothetical protein
MHAAAQRGKSPATGRGQPLAHSASARPPTLQHGVRQHMHHTQLVQEPFFFGKSKKAKKKRKKERKNKKKENRRKINKERK